MWRHGWLGDWRREACIGEAILAPWTGKENCAFDKDTPFLDFNCNTICLATNQVFPLRIEAGIRLSHKGRRAGGPSKNELLRLRNGGLGE